MVSSPRKRKIFICYADEDANSARRLYDDLTTVGLEPWLDKEKIRGGEYWKDAIYEGIHKNRYFIPLLSKISVKKVGFVQKELKYALDLLEHFPPNRKFIIPVRLDKCKIPYQKLNEIQRIDIFNNWDDGLNKILQSLDIDPKILKKRKTRPELIRPKPLRLPSGQNTDNRFDNEFEFEPIVGQRNENNFEKIENPNEEDIRYFIGKYKDDDNQSKQTVLKKFDKLSQYTKLYNSVSFTNFLRELRTKADKHEIVMFLYILHNLVILSSKNDPRIYSKLRDEYLSYLSIAFADWERREILWPSKIEDILNSFRIGIEEWCSLHWIRIKNAIDAGIDEDEISTIERNIAFLRNNRCKALPLIREYLDKKDNHIKVKKRIEALLIND
jgi:hypothetical protein